MKKIFPNVNPNTFTGLAIIVGYLLIDDFSSIQQVAISSWLNLVADILSANASWMDVLEERNEQCKKFTDHLKEEDDKKEDENNQKETKKQNDDIELIIITLEKMQKDIQDLLKDKS